MAEDDGDLKAFLGEDAAVLQGFDLDTLNEKVPEVGEEKDQDAEDFGDISDDDLADEDQLDSRPRTEAPQSDEADEDDNLDDLFGDGGESPEPEAKDEAAPSESADVIHNSIENAPLGDAKEVEEDEDTREQRLLFEAAARRVTGAASGIPPPPPTDDELFSTIWPQFEPDRPPRFGELMPQKKAYYNSEKPARPPRPLNPTRVNLDLEPDQEKHFKLPEPPPLPFDLRQAEAEAKGFVLLEQEAVAEESSDEQNSIELSDDAQEVGGVTWQDLVALCEDWDIPSQADAPSDDDQHILHNAPPKTDDTFMDDDSDGFDNPRPAKRRRLDADREPFRVFHSLNHTFEDPEKATARLAKKVRLDLNDPYLLVEERPPVASKKRSLGAFKRDTTGGLSRSLAARYNISNDEAYEALKQNHQSKIRAQIGNTALEHAIPAVRLQYPFYKQDLSTRERRLWHRPVLHVTPGDVTFKRLRSLKKREMKTKEPHEAFFRTSDLTMGDNANMLLLEYSEENPPMLSSFGMGNRMINYYRRKDNEDTSRPRMEVGETSVLLPQDKSPFDRFGDVDRGKTVTTLSNTMFRAPIFSHAPKSTDFLISRSSSGVDGSTYYIRNVDNLHVVGQEFPFIQVPGPKARAATNVGKMRLHMVSYRMYKKKGGKLNMDDVKRHNPYTDMPTMRTKMKEFMEFDKSGGQGKGVWKSKREVPDEAEIRTMVKPDEVVLLYAMQVGQQQLSDSGYHKRGDEELEEEEDEDADAPGSNLDKQLAPWNTTKNFLTSCKGGAMLAVHGEGDPSGRGEALSMIKTSMKGGFKAIGQSIEDRLNTQKQKELGGHKYNVARQNQEYADAIRRVWDAQARALSSTEAHEDQDMGGIEDAAPNTRAATPASAMKARREDESASMFSSGSGLEQGGKVMKISRLYRDKYGNEDTHEEVVRDPRVIREYQKRRREADLARLTLDQMIPTGDPEQDAAMRRRLEDERDRLSRNIGARDGREKARHSTHAGSPDAMSPDEDEYIGKMPAAAAPKRQKYTSGTTQRKCANCGQVGHIKTNKKLCPMLNGTMSTGNANGQSAFGAISGAQPNSVTQEAPTTQESQASPVQPLQDGGGSSFE